MADSNTTTPLISPSKSADESELPQPTENTYLPSIGSTVELCLKEFNPSQFFQSLLVSFAWFFEGYPTFITVFTDSSIISEWNLNPKDPILTGLPASSYFIGCVVGGFALSTLADTTLGRKNMLFYSCLFMAIFSLLAAFSPNLWVFSFLRFLSGFSRSTIATTSLVLATELVGKKWRAQVGVMAFLCSFFQFLSLPAMAYLNRNSSWRNLFLYTSIPTIFYSVLVKLFVRESPRWLLVRGRKDEATNTLQSIASITQSSVNLAVSKMRDKEETSDENMDLFSALKVLMKKQWASRRIIVVMAMGFGIGVVYYGMPLGLETLSFNLYLSVAFNALAELPACLITFILIDKFNRRSCVFVFAIMSGIFSLLSVMDFGGTWSKLVIGFESVSFFCASTAFNLYVLFTTELFPTCVRNSALAMGRQTAVLGGAVSPLLVAAGRRDKFWCYGVFGMVITMSGLFVVLLPETKGRGLCDTMEEEEAGKRRLVSSDMLA